MVDAMNAARFLISLDQQQHYFNKKIVYFNNHDFYEGNARLNKILHLAQNIYIGKHNSALIDDIFYAYDNGSVIPKIQENYSMLLGTRDSVPFDIDEENGEFLQKVFTMLKDAPLEELIEIDHEDPAWQEKHMYFYKKDQMMDSLKFADIYRDMYEAANFYFDRMVLS